MAATYTFQAGFEGNACDGDLTETDTTSAGSVMHYTDMVIRHNIDPWRGAYSYVIDQSVCTTTECKLVSAICNVTTAYYWALGFAFYAKGTTMATTNQTTLAALISASGLEVALNLYYTTAAGLQLSLTETAGATATCVADLTENKWHWIELYGRNHSTDGTAYMVLDGQLVPSGLTGLDQAAITDLQLGVDDQDAGHTAGVYAFDDIYFAIEHVSVQPRIGYRSQYSMNPHVSAITTSTYLDCIFIGPGTVSSVDLLSGTSGDVIRLYDTDTGYYTGVYADALVAEIANTGTELETNTIFGPFRFERGCLATITVAGNTVIRGIVHIDSAPKDGYPIARCYGNKALLKDYAYRRTSLTGSR